MARVQRDLRAFDCSKACRASCAHFPATVAAPTHMHICLIESMRMHIGKGNTMQLEIFLYSRISTSPCIQGRPIRPNLDFVKVVHHNMPVARRSAQVTVKLVGQQADHTLITNDNAFRMIKKCSKHCQHKSIWISQRPVYPVSVCKSHQYSAAKRGSCESQLGSWSPPDEGAVPQ